MTETTVRERAILFSGEMVRAILDGHKTQTRRVVKPSGTQAFELGMTMPEFRASLPPRCPYGVVGDRLWVRETWAIEQCGSRVSLKPEAWPNGWPLDRLLYNDTGTKWWNARPSIHMPRWASRLTLEITDVRVERLQAISDEDAVAEGILGDSAMARDNYRELWDSLNKSRGYSWEINPWVWVLGFRARPAQEGER